MTTGALHTCWQTRSGRTGSRGDMQALFPYWSFTKTVIAICALQLVEEKRLSLDKPSAGLDFTPRQLLGHTSGLPDYGGLTAYHAAVARKDAPWSREKLLQQALAQGALFEPDQGWSYSNIGYLNVRQLIENTTGQSLATVIRERITAPLDLPSVQFWRGLDQSATLHWSAAADYHPDWVYHGSLIGTAPDALCILAALMKGDLLSTEMLQQMNMRTPLGGAIAGRPWSQCGYGLGLMSGAIPDSGRAIGHSGAGPFCVNAIYHFPDRDDPLTVASFTDGPREGVAEFDCAKVAAEV